MLNRPYVVFTDQQLQARLKDAIPESAEQSIILDEIERRRVERAIHRASKPHWVDWATFIIVILGLAISVIVYWPQLTAFFQSLRSSPHNFSVP
jgi:hypothetical protein